MIQKLKLIHIRVTEVQYDALEKLARGSSISNSQIIRLAITEYLNRMEQG